MLAIELPLHSTAVAGVKPSEAGRMASAPLLGKRSRTSTEQILDREQQWFAYDH